MKSERNYRGRLFANKKEAREARHNEQTWICNLRVSMMLPKSSVGIHPFFNADTVLSIRLIGAANDLCRASGRGEVLAPIQALDLDGIGKWNVG